LSTKREIHLRKEKEVIVEFLAPDANICCQLNTIICKACHEGIGEEEYCTKFKYSELCSKVKIVSRGSGGGTGPVDVILTSVFDYKKDPQRHKKISSNFDYIANFYNSVHFHKLNAVIFHTGFSEDFVRMYTTKHILFRKVLPNVDMSTNDYRFEIYSKFIKSEDVGFVLMVDASDVFFNTNPFNYMHDHEHGHTLFMSPDIGNFHSKAWRVNRCYGDDGKKWDQNVRMYNAGVWGGGNSEVNCLLKCMVKQFEKTNGNGNCNMPVLNWCVHFGGCTDENTIEDKPDFVNPFRKECRGDHIIVHNKCRDTEGKVCLVKQGSSLVLAPKNRKCVPLSTKVQGKSSQKCAIVSYISSSNFVGCLKVLSYSAMNTTKYPMVVALTTDISIDTRNDIIRQLPQGVKVIDFKPVKNPNKRITNKHFKNNYAILNTWKMVEYNRVVVIDADMLVTKTLDHLCEMDLHPKSLAAANNWWTSKRVWDDNVFNGGLLVLHPSEYEFKQLTQASKTFKSDSGGVQPFLNDYFKNRWVKLDAKRWGMNANAFELRPETWDDSKIHAIHYTTKAKPCHTSEGQFINEPLDHPYRLWHKQYHAILYEEQQKNVRIYNDGKSNNEHSRNACILYLLTKESGPTGKKYESLLKTSVRSLEKYFFTVVRYPICIIHTPDVNVATLKDIAGMTKSRIIAYEVEFRYPLHKASVYEKKTPTAPKCVSKFNPNKVWHINYLHMCHFFTHGVFYHPVFKEFDWLFRLDADSGFDLPIPCDPFDIMETKNAVFGYYKKEKQGGGCAGGLHHAVVKDFLPKTKLSLKFDVKPNDAYLGAFHIFKTSFFTQSNMMKFWDWLDLKSFSYEMRTGEQAVIPYALSLEAADDKIHQFSGYGLWHRIESNKLWRDRLNIPTQCQRTVQKEKQLGLMVVAHPDDEIIFGESMLSNDKYDIGDEWSTQPIPNKSAPCTPTYTDIHGTLPKIISKKWKKCEGLPPPPLFMKQDITNVLTETSKDNIIVILIDALSRAHAMRTLPKSMKWLMENNGVSLGRYHITGFHSEENQTPLVSGSPHGSKLSKKSYLPSRAKDFGYITQYASIADRNAKLCSKELFDYWNTRKTFKLDKNKGFCIGNTQASEVALQSILDFFSAHPEVPKFSYSYFLEPHWWKPVSVNGVYSTLLDEPLLRFFKRIPELHRTTIVLMSDHGSNFWEQRSVRPEVSIEHKLPLAVIKGSNSANLHLNKWKLITHYDMYASLVGIMGGDANRGTNFFTDIIPDTRTCSQSGIPTEFCLCAPHKKKEPTTNVINAAVLYINEHGHFRDSERCMKLLFTEFVERENNIRISGGGPGEFIYKFMFKTTLGRVFEASMYHHTLKDATMNEITVQYVKQISQYDDMRECLGGQSGQGSNLPKVEYCACSYGF
jgi:hypothetical protein